MLLLSAVVIVNVLNNRRHDCFFFFSVFITVVVISAACCRCFCCFGFNISGNGNGRFRHDSNNQMKHSTTSQENEAPERTLEHINNTGCLISFKRGRNEEYEDNTVIICYMKRKNDRRERSDNKERRQEINRVVVAAVSVVNDESDIYS